MLAKKSIVLLCTFVVSPSTQSIEPATNETFLCQDGAGAPEYEFRLMSEVLNKGRDIPGGLIHIFSDSSPLADMFLLEDPLIATITCPGGRHSSI